MTRKITNGVFVHLESGGFGIRYMIPLGTAWMIDVKTLWNGEVSKMTKMWFKEQKKSTLNYSNALLYPKSKK